MQIVSGKIAVGELVPGDLQLAERYGVSRTVLREAMKTLAAKGLVVPKARVGTRVRSRQSWNLFDPDVLAWHLDGGVKHELHLHISEIRMAFEPHAAGLAAQHACEEVMDELETLAIALGNSDCSAEQMARTDLKFHLGILESCGNPFMRGIGNLIEVALADIFKLSSPVGDEAGMKAVALAHLEIVHAIRRRDRDAAKRAMEDVIETGRQNLSRVSVVAE
jgi:DNA-binding FadR family transcriptional regulator